MKVQGVLIHLIVSLDFKFSELEVFGNKCLENVIFIIKHIFSLSRIVLHVFSTLEAALPLFSCIARLIEGGLKFNPGLDEALN